MRGGGRGGEDDRFLKSSAADRKETRERKEGEEELRVAEGSKLWKDKRKSGNRCYNKRRVPGYFVANPF